MACGNRGDVNTIDTGNIGRRFARAMKGKKDLARQDKTRSRAISRDTERQHLG